jgi:hypothetical protein
VTPSAPRYPVALLAAIAELDDDGVPIAEVCRRIADHVAAVGVIRPSYVHLRRLVHASRERRAAVAELRGRVVADALTGRVTNPLWLAERVRELPRGVERRGE